MYHLDVLGEDPLPNINGQTPYIARAPLRNQPNGHNDPNLQLSVSTNNLDYFSELQKEWPGHTKATNHTKFVMIIATPV